jgi:regulatory protein
VPDVAAQVVERLRAERLLSDERFIEALISAKRRRGQGPLRVRQELEKKGIAREVIEQWLDPRGREWIELLEEVRRKKFGARQPKNYAERAKQARFLQYRGFTSDQIQQVLNARDIE